MTRILLWTIQLMLLPTFSPLVLGIIKKIKAKLQNRKGASIFQPYRDIWKLFHKDEVISTDASWLFRAAPYIVFSVTLAVAANVPTYAAFLSNSLTGDFLAIVYLLAIGTFFLALAGMDTGSAFGGFGSSREMTMAALAECGMIFSLFTLTVIAKTTNLFSIATTIVSNGSSFFLPIFIAFIGFLIVLLAETARFPFDNPATHLELTMIHEAMILEYSGKKLALMEWASANKLMIFIALGSSLFFPWGIATSGSAGAILFGLAIFALKVLVFCVAIAVLESSIAKFRFFRLPDLLLTSFILGLIAIGLVIMQPLI